jgi:acyl-CoA reductase-like NAD-dependent aldehyde dehydrogenase
MKREQAKEGAPPFEKRLERLDQIERGVVERTPVLAAAVSRDFGGRSSRETMAEVYALVEGVRYSKQHLRDWMDPQDREVGWAFLPSRAEVIPQPVGVVGIISPWNYPLLTTLSPLVAALASGNRAMLKPSELVPETAAVMRDLVSRLFSEDQVTVVTGGSGPELGELFSSLAFDHLVFTGSARVGKLVMRAASENLVPVTLELGGKSPAIVGLDCAPRVAAARIMAGKLFNAGQTCIAPDYALVPAGARDEFVECCKASVAKMYPTIEKNPDYTSIVSAQHLQRLHAIVDDARALGAQVLELKPSEERLEETRKLAPTLVLDATDEMRALKEEIFGPVLPIVTYRTFDEAIAYVNDRPRPLALYYFGRKQSAIRRVLSETVSGAVTVNETLLHALQADLPFGGVGPSGMGHCYGREGFYAFSKMKPVYWQSRIDGVALLRPPYGKTADRLLRFLVGS